MRKAVASRLALAVMVLPVLAQCTSVGSFSNFDSNVSGLTAEPNAILADGQMVSTLNLHIFYSPGVPAASVPVQFVPDSPNVTITPSSGQSDANGTLVAALRTTHRGRITVSANVGGQGVDSTLSAAIAASAPAAALQLVAGAALEADTPAVAGITILDNTNTVVPGYRGTIVLTSSDPNAILPPAHTFAAADSGTYTFTGLQLQNIGIQTLTATDINNPNLQQQVSISVTRHRQVRLTVAPPVVAGVAQTLQVAVTDLGGNTVANYAGTLTLSCSDPNATFPANIVFTPNDAGIVTLQQNLIFRTAGTQSLSALDEAVADILGSNPNIVVQAAGAARLLVGGLSGGIAGTQQTLVLTALDAFNNVAVSYRGTVHFASSDPQAVLPGDTLFTVMNAGVFSYPSVALLTAGLQSVTATDTDAPLITGNANNLLITNAPASQLLVTAAEAATAGVPIGSVVTAFDPYRNQARDFTGRVAITATDPNAQLPASHTYVSGDAGTYSFSLIYETAGVQTLTAQISNMSAWQATVVDPGPVQALVVGGIDNGPAGMARSAFVRAVDDFNNTVTAYRGVVEFNSTDTRAQLPAPYGFTQNDAGAKTFGLTLLTTGYQSVSVADVGNANLTASQNEILVTSGNSTLRVTSPNTVLAGVAFSATIAAVDPYGNLDANYTGMVHFFSPDPQSTLPGDTLLTAGDMGSMTLGGFVLRTATSDQSITAADTNVATRDGMHTGIVVLPAAAVKFGLVAPSSTTAGAQFTVTVGAYDIYNNLVPSYAGTVDFNSTDMQATLPGSATFNTSDAGSRTFVHGVALRESGNQNITVADGNLIPATVAVAVADAGAETLILSTAAQAVAGSPLDVTVTAEDAYGNVARDYSGTVGITGQDPNGSYGPLLVFGPSDDGNKFAPHQVTLTTAGAQLLTATDTNNAAIAASNALVTVLPAAGIDFSLEAPATALAGAPFAATITVYDVYANVATSYGSTAALSSDDTQGAPSNTASLTVPFAAGLANRQQISGITLRTAGTRTLTVQDINNAAVPASATATVFIDAAMASHFGLSAPATVVAGAPFSVTITALDGTGNVNPNYAGTLTWSATGTGALLPGVTTIGNANQGNITVSGLALQQAGTQTVQVTDANGVTGGIQISVDAASAATLQIAGAATAVAGTPVSVTVTAYDIYNNLASAYTGTVGFTKSDGAASVPGSTTFSVGDAGRHIFVNGVTFRTDGNQTVTVSGNGNVTSATLNVNVRNGAASVLTLSAPATAAAGTPFTVTISAQDAYGNTAVNFNDTVVLTGQDPNGTFGPPIVFTAANQGTRTLVGEITLETAGAQVVTATDANNNEIGLSNAVVTVNPATIAYLDMNAPTTVAASSPFAVTITGYDAYNNIANTYGGTASLLSDDPSGTPSNTSALTVHFASGSQAVRTITGVTLHTAGNHNLTVQDANNSVNPVPDSVAVQVVPAGATRFGITAPTTTTAGAPVSATVVALDASGNTATNYVGTVHWSSSDPDATLPAATDFNSTNMGSVAVSGLVLSTAGSAQTLQVVDGNGLTGTTDIAVTNAAGYALQLSGATATVAGVPMTLHVVAKDIYNNTVTNYNNTVHFSSSDTNATLPADTNYTPADAGSRNFTQGAILRTDGNQTISVSDGHLIGATLATSVTNAPASTLVLGIPATATAGQAFNVTVSARDAYGNLALNFNDTVNLSGGDPKGSYGAAIVFNSANQGTKTLTNYVTLKSAGSQVMLATDATNANVATANAIISVAATSISRLGVGAPAQVAAASPFSVTVTGYDIYNNIVTTYSGTTSILSDDPQGTPSNTSPLTVQFASGSSAVRTVAGVLLDTAGNHNLTVQDVNNSVTPTPATAAVQVVPAGATHYSVSLPASVVAGTTFSATITALDASGNTDPNHTGTITLTTSDSNHTLPAPTVLPSADHGVITIGGLVLLNAGTAVTVTATDGNGLTGQGTMTVLSGNATTLKITGASTALAGTPMSVTVSAYDAYTNPATGYTGTVHFTGDGGNTTMPSNYTFASGDAGTKTFTSGVVLRVAGLQNVIVGDSNLPSASLAVNVRNAAAAALLMTLPAGATAGVPFNATVAAQDAYGNIAIDYNGTVVFSSQDGNGTYGSPFLFTPTQAGNTTLGNYVTLRTSGYTLVTVTDANHASVSPASVLMPVSAAGIASIGLQSPATATAAIPVVVTVTGYDNFNNITSSFNGNITLTSTDVQGTPSTAAPLTLAFNSGSQALRSVSGVILRTAGNVTLTAKDLANGSITNGNANVVVSAGAATQLNLTLPPSATAGIAISPGVTAYDSAGNIAPSYRGKVIFSSTDAQATLPGYHIFVAGDAGQYTATNLLTLRTAGTSSVSVQDSNNAVTANTNTINVTWGSPNHLTVSMASTQTAGSTLSPNVTCFDAFSNIVGNYNGTVSFSSTDPCASLPGTTIFTSGQQVFTNGATLTTAGNQNITVTDAHPGPASGTTGTLITAGTGVQVKLSIPATVTAGTAFDVRVIPYDVYGNPNAGFSGAVVFLTPYDPQASVTAASYAFPNPSVGSLFLPGAVTMRTAGTRALFVEDLNNANDVSNANIVVTAASMAGFAFGPREIVTAGVSFSTTLSATDPYGNTVSSYSNTVTVSSTDSAGSPAKNSNWSRSLTSGQVTLTGVSFSTLEHQYLTATQGSYRGTGHYMVHYDMNFVSGQNYNFNIGDAGGTAPDPVDFSGAAYGSYTTPSGLYYLPDPGDNRVMVYSSFPSGNAPGPLAVLGQSDFNSNVQGCDANHMYEPISVTGDGNGGIFVADYSNERILHYNTPPTSNVAANGVIGQSTFAGSGCNCSRAGLCYPMTMTALSDLNVLIVADQYQNRVLFYQPIPISNSNNVYATMVLGQANMTSCGIGSGPSGVNQPRGVWSDGTRLVVSDQINHRVLIWENFNTVLNNGISGVPANWVIGQTDLNSNVDPGSTPTSQVVRWPNAVESDGTHLFVVDNEFTRVMIFNTLPTSNNVAADGVLMQSNLVSQGCSTYYCNGEGLYIHGPNLLVGMWTRGGNYIFSSQ